MQELTAPEAQVVASAPIALRPLVLDLRSLILSVHPSATILAWPRQRIISFGFGPQKMTEHYVFVAAHARHVNLGVYRGVHLEGAGLTLEGTGKNLRHVKCFAASDTKFPWVRALVREAFEERRAALAVARPGR